RDDCRRQPAHDRERQDQQRTYDETGIEAPAQSDVEHGRHADQLQRKRRHGVYKCRNQRWHHPRPAAEPCREQISQRKQLLSPQRFRKQYHQQQAEEIRHKRKLEIAREPDRKTEPHPADEHSRTRIRADDCSRDLPESRAPGTDHIVLISLDLEIIIRRDTEHRAEVEDEICNVPVHRIVPFQLGMLFIIPLVPLRYKQKKQKTSGRYEKTTKPRMLCGVRIYFSTSSIASLLYWLKLTLMPSASSTVSIVSGMSSSYSFVSMNSSPLK